MTTMLKRIIATFAAAAVAATLVLLTTTPSDAATPRLTVTALKSAWVPSLCGQRSGHLVDGEMPGIPAGHGQVHLRAAKVAFGRFAADGPREAAAGFSCDQGGVPWPDYVLFYRPGPDGPVYDGKVDLGRLRHFENGSIRSVRIAHRRAIVRWTTGEPDECAACGNVAGLAILKPRPHSTKVRVVRTSFFSYQQIARKIIRNVNAGHWRTVRTNATAQMVGWLKDLKAQHGRLAVVKGSCHSTGDGFNWTCDLADAQGYILYAMELRPVAFRDWRAVDLLV